VKPGPPASALIAFDSVYTSTLKNASLSLAPWERGAAESEAAAQQHGRSWRPGSVLLAVVAAPLARPAQQLFSSAQTSRFLSAEVCNKQAARTTCVRPCKLLTAQVNKYKAANSRPDHTASEESAGTRPCPILIVHPWLRDK